ncbi:Thiosulfate sulfurtransferase 16, chloroplastic [Linum grandiflorum]
MFPNRNPRFAMAAAAAVSLLLFIVFQKSAVTASIQMAFQVLQGRDIRITNIGTIANGRIQPPSPTFDKQPRSVVVRAAYQLLEKGHVYLDIRTFEEFNAGHPAGAVNIPYLLNKGAGMSKNPKFLDQVSSKFDKQEKILVGCQSGMRSLMAVADMQTAGFTSVVAVAGGYNSWVQNGLPTTTKKPTAYL